MKHKIARPNRFGTINISQLVLGPNDGLLLAGELESAVISAVEGDVPESDEEISTSPDSAVGCWTEGELEGREQRSVSPGELPLVRLKDRGRESSRPPTSRSSGVLRAVTSPVGEEIVDPVWLEEPTRVMTPEQLERELEMDERRQLVELAV